jgi:DNA invertase Pin-like site-specific DNA recombinase
VVTSTNGQGPKKAILYARVSTEEQARSGYSLAQQMETLRQYAAHEGYEVLEEVTDPGESGAFLERPGLDRVRELVAGGGVSAVLAQDGDRISREPWHHEYLKLLFEDYGTELRALDDGTDGSPIGDFVAYIRRGVAKLEKADIAKRSRRGLLTKAREGKVVGTHRSRFGFRFNEAKDGYEVDEEQMTVVRRIFRMVGLEGRPSTRCAKPSRLPASRAPGEHCSGPKAISVRRFRTTFIARTPSMNWKASSRRRWQVHSIPTGAMEFSTTTAGASRRRRSPPRIPGEMASLTDTLTKRSRSRGRSGCPSRCRTRGYRPSGWTVRARP